jgi:hypothetical protein
MPRLDRYAVTKDIIKQNLKLYVWEDVFCDYTCGMAMAIAESKKEAIKLITKNMENWETSKIRELEKNEPNIHELDEKPSYYVTGGG